MLEHSTDKAELGKALEWAKELVAKEPNNEEYKKTLAAIQAKLN